MKNTLGYSYQKLKSYPFCKIKQQKGNLFLGNTYHPGKNILRKCYHSGNDECKWGKNVLGNSYHSGRYTKDIFCI